MLSVISILSSLNYLLSTALIFVPSVRSNPSIQSVTNTNIYADSFSPVLREVSSTSTPLAGFTDIKCESCTVRPEMADANCAMVFQPDTIVHASMWKPRGSLICPRRASPLNSQHTKSKPSFVEKQNNHSKPTQRRTPDLSTDKVKLSPDINLQPPDREARVESILALGVAMGFLLCLA
ncbi:unnamed protein product [Blumeria hordei]|uniref:Uncharacterized protein n=1 Tax=Blumeria hordei TaxID=2867405 RepID=A0A383URT7_BLUHO|nr:unnamed protein product [Blumeria hordei]